MLVWVQEKDGAEIRQHMYFFETLVRIHRAGEGAAYAGLKPAGKTEPPIAAADRSLKSGKLQEVAKLVSGRMEQGLHRTFEAASVRRRGDHGAGARAKSAGGSGAHPLR